MARVEVRLPALRQSGFGPWRAMLPARRLRFSDGQDAYPSAHLECSSRRVESQANGRAGFKCNCVSNPDRNASSGSRALRRRGAQKISRERSKVLTIALPGRKVTKMTTYSPDGEPESNGEARQGDAIQNVVLAGDRIFIAELKK